MRLTRFTDYSLRVLIYLGLNGSETSEVGCSQGGRATIREISEAYSISRNHLMKVVSNLTRMGYINARRGPGGGITLARSASEINLARVVQDTEDDMNLVECFCGPDQCIIQPVCQLRKALNEALEAYLKTLRDYSLQDLLKPADDLIPLLGLGEQAS